jgi:multisubunit Na+/H+ antiporter MnhF subunit
VPEVNGRLLSRGYSYLAVALVGYIFVLVPLGSDLPQGGLLVQTVFSIILATAVYVCANRRWELYISLALFAPAFFLSWLGQAGLSQELGLLQLASGAAFLLYTASVVLGSTLRSKVISTDTISGAVAVYLLIAVAWSLIYGIILILDPTAIELPGVTASVGDVRATESLMYFSFVTITTLGFGDILPLSAVARSAATFEAVVGQIYLTVLVARFVGLQIAQSND